MTDKPAYQSELSMLQETLRTALEERDALKVENAELQAELNRWKRYGKQHRGVGDIGLAERSADNDLQQEPTR